MTTYTLDPSASFYQNILKVYEMKMAEEKNKFNYINPNMMSEILDKIEAYGRFEVDEKIWDWVRDMYGA
jgi:hypothetical protein